MEEETKDHIELCVQEFGGIASMSQVIWKPPNPSSIWVSKIILLVSKV